MATETNYTLQLDLAYTNTDFTRSYRMTGISAAAAQDANTKITAINTSLAGGTAGSLSSTFIAEDFDTVTSVGYLEKIDRMVVTTTTETDLV